MVAQSAQLSATLWVFVFCISQQPCESIIFLRCSIEQAGIEYQGEQVGHSSIVARKIHKGIDAAQVTLYESAAHAQFSCRLYHNSLPLVSPLQLPQPRT